MAHIDCVCPPRTDGTARHPNGDTVTLRERLDFKDGVYVKHVMAEVNALDKEARESEYTASLMETWVLVGVESWTLIDDKGKALPVTRPNVRAFMNDHQEEALVVANEAHTRYYDVVLGPLVKRALELSAPTQTTGLTSQATGSTSTRQKPSKRSLTTTSQTDGIARMSASHDGVSNSSQR